MSRNEPIRVDPDCENAVVVSPIVPRGHADDILNVDGDGIVRKDDGDAARYGRVVAVDVDAEAWGGQYHHPADCPEKNEPFPHRHEATRRQCDWCTPARSPETPVRDRIEPPNPDAEPPSLDELESMLKNLDTAGDTGRSHPKVFMPAGIKDALKAESRPEQ